jgi:hypothetical protein
MDKIKGYEIVLGAALVISLLIGGYELISYTPENFVPRENVCIAPHIHEGGLNDYWENAVSRTGVGAGTAHLTRLKAEIRPDGTIDKIELEFLADKGGTHRQYQLWYRRDARSCGWSDGLSYPEKPGVTSSPLPVNPGHILSELGQVRSADLNLSGRYLVIETITTPELATAADILPPGVTFVLRNGTLVSTQSLETDTTTPLPLSLLVSERDCTSLKDGDPGCSTTPAARVYYSEIPPES